MAKLTMLGLILTVAVAGESAMAAAPAAPAAKPAALEAAPAAPPVRSAPAPKKRTPAPVKVTASQLWMRLDTIEGRLDQMQKSLDGIGSSAATAAAGAAAAARPAPVAAPGESAQARELAGAFYNYGVYERRAANTRLAATLIRDVTVVTGGIIAAVGWENARGHTDPWTIPGAFKTYKGFSIGVTTALVGLIVGEILDMSANRSQAAAAKALMRPLEEEPPSGPAPKVEVQ